MLNDREFVAVWLCLNDYGKRQYTFCTGDVNSHLKLRYTFLQIGEKIAFFHQLRLRQ